MSTPTNFPEDTEKLSRVRERLQQEGLDALVVRAPDNVLYLTNYWPMKGYCMAVFPAEGDPTLLLVEPQLSEARKTTWTDDIRTFKGYDPGDARPPVARSREGTVDVLQERGLTGAIGVELSQFTQLCDRMVGEPTVYTQEYFDTFRNLADEVVDATPILSELRMIKTPQEIERMRRANELATDALYHCKENIDPGNMRESDVGAMLEGYVHSQGVGYRENIEMARAFTLIWSGDGIATFTQTHDNPIQENEPTLIEIWVGVDGYWTDLTRNIVPGDNPKPEYCELLENLLEIQQHGVDLARVGAPMSELDREMRQRIDDWGYTGQPSHPVVHGIGARIHEPPYPHQAGNGTLKKNMVLSIEPGVYWEGGGGLRVEDSFLITDDEPEKLCAFPDDFRT